MKDREQLCKKFTELIGWHWHEFLAENKGQYQCSCLNSVIYNDKNELNKHIKKSNHTYKTPADVLKVMARRDDYNEFICSFQKKYRLDINEFIEKYIIESDTLLKAAVEFLEERNGK